MICAICQKGSQTQNTIWCCDRRGNHVHFNCWEALAEEKNTPAGKCPLHDIHEFKAPLILIEDE